MIKKTEAGQGGKLGRSNMSHYEGSKDLKIRSKRQRRHEARQIELSVLKAGGTNQEH